MAEPALRNNAGSWVKAACRQAEGAEAPKVRSAPLHMCVEAVCMLNICCMPDICACGWRD